MRQECPRLEQNAPFLAVSRKKFDARPLSHIGTNMLVKFLAGRSFAAKIGGGLLLTAVFAHGEEGRVKREIWNNIPGGELSHFTSSLRYFQQADQVSLVTGSVSPTDAGARFAERLRTCVTAPETGDYVFWIASDDDSELWISATDSKFGRTKIASLAGYVTPRNWDSKPSQKSNAVPLVQGQRYFLEGLHKEGEYGDHFAIVWTVPSGARGLIPASVLNSYDANPNDLDNDELLDDWKQTYGFSTGSDTSAPASQHPLAHPGGYGFSNLEECLKLTDPTSKAEPGIGDLGRMAREVWYDIPGSQQGNFTWNPRYWEKADAVSTTGGAVAPTNTVGCVPWIVLSAVTL